MEVLKLLLSKEKLIKDFGFEDKGEYGCAFLFPKGFRFDHYLYVNDQDVYFVTPKISGNDIQEVDRGLRSIAFREPDKAQKAKALLIQIGYEFKKEESSGK